MIYRNYWLVVGRVLGDDEDTVMKFENCTREQVVESFKESMWEMEFDYIDSVERAEARAQAELLGAEVFINGVFASDSPIEEQ